LSSLQAQRGVQDFTWQWQAGLEIAGQAWVFPGPHSATGEDVVELHLVGSEPIVQALLHELLASGSIRAAEAGEFTRRAFLSGKLDLAQAEAVLDLVQARNAAEARAAAAVLTGALGGQMAIARRALSEAMVQIEAGLDFEEGDSQDLQPGEVEGSLRSARVALTQGLDQEQARARESTQSCRIGLWGAPNAGKSSLFRRLTGQSALVEARAGTTRDRLEAIWRPQTAAADASEIQEVAGLDWWLADGPGLSEQSVDARDSAAQARARLDRFDLLLYVIDASTAAAELPPRLENQAAIVVFNKADMPKALPAHVLHELQQWGPCVWVSAENGQGLEALERAVAQAVAAQQGDQVSALRATQRHQQALRMALEAVERADEWDQVGGHQDLVAEELRTALRGLAELVGEFTPEDLLDQLFSSFCIGK